MRQRVADNVPSPTNSSPLVQTHLGECKPSGRVFDPRSAWGRRFAPPLTQSALWIDSFLKEEVDQRGGSWKVRGMRSRLEDAR